MLEYIPTVVQVIPYEDYTGSIINISNLLLIFLQVLVQD